MIFQVIRESFHDPPTVSHFQIMTPSLVPDIKISHPPAKIMLNTGIKHDFPFINIRKVPREVLKTEGEARGFQHLPRDLGNVNE